MDPRDRAAQAAVQHVRDGMTVGLGSGDSAARAIRLLRGRRIQCVATSEAAAALGRSVGLDVRPAEGPRGIDLTIDGADEVDPRLRLLKGGGGAHTREKLVAAASHELIIVVDAAKCVGRLGEKAPLAVEVVGFGCEWTLARLEKLGLTPRLRPDFITDGGNCIADCGLAAALDLEALAAALKATLGVVEHGLFLTEASFVYVGQPHGVTRLDR